MRQRASIAIAITVSACGDAHSRSHGVPIAAIETAIGNQLHGSARLRCGYIVGMPVGCVATIDRVELPVRIAMIDGAWEWQLDRVVIATDAIAAYVKTELPDDRSVSCTPRFRIVGDAPLICELGGGGKAFVTLHPDGSVADLEVELDPVAANARASEMNEGELVKMSAALAHEDDGEEEDHDDDSPSDAPAIDGPVR